MEQAEHDGGCVSNTTGRIGIYREEVRDDPGSGVARVEGGELVKRWSEHEPAKVMILMRGLPGSG